MGPLVENWQTIIDAFYGPLRLQAILPHPFKLAHFGLPAIRSASGLARSQFKGSAARAIFAGMSWHSMLTLESPTSAAAGLVLVPPPHWKPDEAPRYKWLRSPNPSIAVTSLVAYRTTRTFFGQQKSRFRSGKVPFLVFIITILTVLYMLFVAFIALIPQSRKKLFTVKLKNLL